MSRCVSTRLISTKRYTVLLLHSTAQQSSQIKHLKSQPSYSTSTGVSISPKDALKPEAITIMPYNRDEVIASVTEFYDFLTTHLHFYPSELKTPPPTGWPQITPPRVDRQRKSDTAVDLFHHLPYLPGGNAQEKWIYIQTICADYTDKTVEQGVEMDLTEYIGDCPWEKLKDPSRVEHIVALGVPEVVSSHISQDYCLY
jgi:hypothetical protein